MIDGMWLQSFFLSHLQVADRFLPVSVMVMYVAKTLQYMDLHARRDGVVIGSERGTLVWRQVVERHILCVVDCHVVSAS